MSNNWLNTLDKCQDRLLLISARLDRYSKAFYIIGNYKMGDSLEKESSEIELLSEEVGKAAGEVVAENLNRAKENSANVLEAALAGIAIATENEKNKDK